MPSANSPLSIAPAGPPGDPPLLLDPVLRLAHALRLAGVPVSTSEVIDARAAMARIDPSDRASVKRAAAATLVKRQDDVGAFDSLFEVVFANRSRSPSSPPARSDGPAPSSAHEITTSLDRPAGADEQGEPADPSADLLEALVDALRRGDTEALRELAEMAVGRFGGIGTQSGATERYYLYRVLRSLELSQLMGRALAATADDQTSEDERPTRGTLADRIEEFREMLAAQIRQNLAALGTADAQARATDHRVTEEVDFRGASPRQLAAMREAIRPLARTLASKMSRRRRRRARGRLDVRRTVRRSLSSGGVPLDPVFRRPKVARPDLYLLCDVSGSVAEFASFTLTLLQAMTGEFPRMRSFAFVDGIDEVTGHLKDVASFLEVRHVLYRADVVRGDGHSDYGAVLAEFSERFGAEVDSRSTIIITGDARSNRRWPSAETLRALHLRARRVYLFDPEPVAEWDTTDSIVEVYRPYLDGVFETRSLRQLAEVVLAVS